MLDRLSRRFLLCMVPLAAALLVGGCGDATEDAADDASMILAEVGDRQVTAEYFQDRLARRVKLGGPSGEDGQPMDMASLEGKLRFLGVIINKELMLAKALQMGYLEHQDMARMWNSLAEYHGVRYFFIDDELDPKDVTQTQIDHYYERLGESRSCQYLIAFDEAEASAARQALLDGVSWSDVVADFHQYFTRGGQIPKMVIVWGEGHEDFGPAVFTLEEGELTEPIETRGGWWVLQVVEITQEPRPDVDLDQARTNIAQHRNKTSKDRVVREILKQRNFYLDYEALRIVMDGLPEREDLLDPSTGQPVQRDRLQPLQIPEEDLERVLMGYDLSGGPEVVTLGEYKDFYDVQNVFERPKKTAPMIALRRKVKETPARTMVTDEMRRRGYMEDPRVRRDVFALVEERLVSRVVEELVEYDMDVSEDDILSYYEQHESTLWRAEQREGAVVRADSLNEAQELRQAWMNDALDDDLELKPTGLLSTSTDYPVNMALFDLEVGEFSEPIEIPNGWSIARLDRIVAREKIALEEVREDIIAAIRSRRQDHVLVQLLDEWREEFGVTIHKTNLARMPSWEE